MLLKDLCEGMMKRSDPYISGDSDVPASRTRERTPTKTTFQKRMETLANRANVSVDQATAAWRQATSEVDDRLENRWALVNKLVKQKLGL